MRHGNKRKNKKNYNQKNNTQKHGSQMIALIILDGFGIRKNAHDNAIANAKMPYYHDLLQSWPSTQLAASGEAVGLPKGYQGNSEVGHLTLGAGRIIPQMMVRINHAIAQRHGTFFKNTQFLKAIRHCKKKKSTLHIMGLVQDQGVHSHQEHLFALLKLCFQQKFHNVFLHYFSDGRDTLPKSTLHYLRQLQSQIKKYPVGRIATICGRYYAMDRDSRWNRTKKAYGAIALARGKHAASANEAILHAYARKETDEFILPTIIGEYKGMQNNDAVIFFNFRLDRARQLTHALTDSFFPHFSRQQKPALFVPMTEYYSGVKNAAFPDLPLKGLLGEVLSKHKKNQLRIAETEKYAHVTYFFNGQQEQPFTTEERILIPSPKDVPTYDKKPEMSARKITQTVLKEINKKVHHLFILNFANADMVGHTGDYHATLQALNVLDHCLQQIIPAVLLGGGTICLTGDHGNAEHMVDRQTGMPKTAHTTNKVPFLLIGKNVKLRNNGGLSDVAPTLLDLFGISKPKEMTGKSLIL